MSLPIYFLKINLGIHFTTSNQENVVKNFFRRIVKNNIQNYFQTHYIYLYILNYLAHKYFENYLLFHNLSLRAPIAVKQPMAGPSRR